jgi:hypothetical protein
MGSESLKSPHRATVVTMNPDDFADIPGLDVLTW